MTGEYYLKMRKTANFNDFACLNCEIYHFFVYILDLSKDVNYNKTY